MPPPSPPPLPRPPTGPSRRRGWLALAGLVAAGWLAGCGTVQEHRARQWARDFARLPAAEQALARCGVIEPGFSARAVYVAWGQPERTSSAAEGEETWFYWAVPVEVPGPDGLPRATFRTRSDPAWPRWSELREVTVRLHQGTVVEFQAAPRPNP